MHAMSAGQNFVCCVSKMWGFISQILDWLKHRTIPAANPAGKQPVENTATVAGRWEVKKPLAEML